MSHACRLCGEPRRHSVADLGATPLANAYLRADQLGEVERYYPLRAVVCSACLLVQIDYVVEPDTLFRHYLYFSSYSGARLESARAFAAHIIERLGLAPGDRVVEVASNDGYLLQQFVARGLDVVGVEPAVNIARAAAAAGVPTMTEFFGASLARTLAEQGQRARLIIANNVLAHVPDPNDFIEGIRILLAPGGVATAEFHHLLSLVEQCQFDTIYHEHFQYFSLATAQRAFAAHGLQVVDVEEIPDQGGSLRLYVRHAGEVGTPAGRVDRVVASERAAGLDCLERYRQFGTQIAGIKLDLLSFLVNARRDGRSVVCYGAAAKGNTLLNYCGVRADLVDYAVDRNPHKQGLFLPGSRIPIRAPAMVRETRPDYLLILPWNLRDEVMHQKAFIREWGGRFVVPVPSLRVLD